MLQNCSSCAPSITKLSLFSQNTSNYSGIHPWGISCVRFTFSGPSSLVAHEFIAIYILVNAMCRGNLIQIPSLQLPKLTKNFMLQSNFLWCMHFKFLYVFHDRALIRRLISLSSFKWEKIYSILCHFIWIKDNIDDRPVGRPDQKTSTTSFWMWIITWKYQV